MVFELLLFFLAMFLGIVIAFYNRRHQHVEVLLSIYLLCAAYFMYEGAFSWLVGNSAF